MARRTTSKVRDPLVGSLGQIGRSDAVLDRAVAVIGDRQEAYRWMGTPVRALGFQTPIAAAATPDGESRVLAVLDQLEHGVY